MILSSLLNLTLDRDPEKSAKLEKYHGKIIQLELLPIALNLFLIVEHTHLTISRECQNPADVIISVITHKDIEVTGDLVFLQDFKNIISEIDPDFEESLSKIIGDPLAHSVGIFFRQANQSQKDFRKAFRNNLTEYLQEEINFLPTRDEAEKFCRDIDKLYLATERLEARLNFLKEEKTIQKENNENHENHEKNEKNNGDAKNT